MWPFRSKDNSKKIEIHLRFWGEENPAYTVHLLVGRLEVLEAQGVIQGSDFRLSNIVTLAAFRKKGYGMTVVGMLMGAARARDCATFTFEDVSPHNIEATSIYRRFGAVSLPPKHPGGHSDCQIKL